MIMRVKSDEKWDYMDGRKCILLPNPFPCSLSLSFSLLNACVPIRISSLSVSYLLSLVF
jgi:hypothetical protein